MVIDPARISRIPRIIFSGIASCRIKNAKIGANTGLKKNTSAAVLADV